MSLVNAIDEAASSVIAHMQNCDLCYPPGIELTEAESKALAALTLSDDAKSGLKKLLIDACSYPSFQYFALVDGVASPDSEKIEEWLGLSLKEATIDDEDEMLHDEFLESYWKYKEK